MKDDGSAYPYKSSPNRGGRLTHEHLVIHFTAGRSAESSINWLTNRAAGASAHLVVARDGSITQLVPFDRIAWHAGRSAWDNRVGLNDYSIGIELDNAGRLTYSGGKWRSWFGKDYPDSEVVEATHKFESSPSGWHAFTEQQIAAAMDVASLLVERYDLLDVIGHDDIAPGRKQDPGPAFPMLSFRAHVMGRSTREATRHETTTKLNIRCGPGTNNPTIEGSPLPKNTPVLILQEHGTWRLVDVIEEVNGVMDLQGWVHSRYLRRLD